MKIIKKEVINIEPWKVTHDGFSIDFSADYSATNKVLFVTGICLRHVVATDMVCLKEDEELNEKHIRKLESLVIIKIIDCIKTIQNMTV